MTRPRSTCSCGRPNSVAPFSRARTTSSCQSSRGRRKHQLPRTTGQRKQCRLRPSGGTSGGGLPQSVGSGRGRGVVRPLDHANKVHGALFRRGRHGRRRHNSVGSRSIRTVCTARRTSDPRYERAHRWMPPGTPPACAVGDLPIPLTARRNPPYNYRGLDGAPCAAHIGIRISNLLGMTSLGNSRKNRGRPIRPQITRGTKPGAADRSRPCEPRGISFRKSYAAFSPFLYECLYVCCCRTREPRARRRPVFRSPGGGAGYHRRPICVAWRGLLITCLSTRGFVIQRRPP